MSDTGHGHELIIVRRHEDEEHEHHSSAWKVAHADFMTAMMAFFLIMWLINVTDDQVRKGISQYFNPIHMSEGSSELKGLNKPSGEEKGKGKGHSDSPLPGDAINLLKLSAGHADGGGENLSPEEAASALQAAAKAAARLAEAQGGSAGAAEAAGEAGKQGEEAGAGLAEALAALASKGAGGAAGEGDSAAFQDPYAVLSRIADEYTAEHAGNGAVTANSLDGDVRAVGSEGGAVDRDPFDPSYWQLSPLPESRADEPGPADSVGKAPPGARPDAAARREGVDVTGPVTPRTVAPPTAAPPPQVETAAKAPEPAEARPAEAAAEVAKPPEPAKVAGQAEAAKAEATKTEVVTAAEAESKAIAAEIEKSVGKVLADGASPGISVTASDEGILVNLTDDARYSMFPVGSAVPDGKTVVLLGEIAGVLAKRDGDVVIRGFTDARPFKSKDYDNWRLSAARAHMAYYMLTRGGLPEKRVVAIEGHADREPKNPADPNAAENRRIEVLIKEPKP